MSCNPRLARLISKALHALSCALMLVLVSAGFGCTASRRLTAPPGDYEDYRTIRLRQGFLPRLEAALRYLEANPEGHWRPEVERWFERADERFLVRHWDDLSNLKRYAEAMQRAPRVGLVEARVEQLERLQKRVAEENATFMAQAREQSRAFQNAKANRMEFARTVTGWVQLLGAAPDYGKPKAAWSNELRQAFFADDAPVHCDEHACSKRFLRSFEIPRADGLETRAVDFSVTLDLSGGALRSAEVSGPALFDRLSEAATARPVDEENLQARAEALGTSAQLLSMALAVGFSDPACEREAVSPVLLSRQCGGKTATVVAAEVAEQRDRVLVAAE